LLLPENVTLGKISILIGGFMKPEKRQRLVLRSIILLVLFLAAGYTLYQNVLSKEAGTKAMLNEKAPEFALQSLDGKKTKLSEYSGKPVLINFFATWCTPCKNEMPAIQSTYEKFKDDGFTVLAVNLSEPKVSVRNLKEQLGTDFTILLDNKNAVESLYDVYKIPSSFFVDPSGKIVRVYEGEMSRKNLNAWVSELVD
jgi:peroxiredoxin